MNFFLLRISSILCNNGDNNNNNKISVLFQIIDVSHDLWIRFELGFLTNFKNERNKKKRNSKLSAINDHRYQSFSLMSANVFFMSDEIFHYILKREQTKQTKFVSNDNHYVDDNDEGH